MSANQQPTIIYEASETTHWKNLFPQKNQLLGSHNLNPGEELVAEITDVQISTIRDQNGNETRVPVLTFKNVAPMVLNITNTRILASLYGENYDRWIGKSIQLYVAEVRAFGTVQTALRIRETKPASNEGIEGYLVKINAAKTLDELKQIFTEIPKHIKPHIANAKDNKKQQLQEASNAQN